MKDEKRLSYHFVGSLYDIFCMPIPRVMYVILSILNTYI